MFMVVWKCNGINLYNYETRTRVLDNNAHHKNAKPCKIRIGINYWFENELNREKKLSRIDQKIDFRNRNTEIFRISTRMKTNVNQKISLNQEHLLTPI